jgi:hypothetical protein
MRLDANRPQGAEVSPSQASAYRTPRWVKVFGVLTFIVIAIFAASHLVGGYGEHMAHGGMDAHVPPAEHSQHRP